MRHKKAHRKLGRSVSHRRALLRSMAAAFFLRERYSTTLARAKELKPLAERLITAAKRGTLAARRRAYSYLRDKSVVHKLFAQIAPRFKSRSGGYTRIVRTGFRHGDAAQMAAIEMVERAAAAPAKKEKSAAEGKTSKPAPKRKKSAATGANAKKESSKKTSKSKPAK